MKPFRIGLAGTHSAIDYPRALGMGVQNTLEEMGHTLIPLAEQIPYHMLTNAESYLRTILSIARRLDLDACIVPAGCMTAYLRGDTAKAVELTELMDPATTLVMEREIDGYRCLLKDNGPGMHECMRHLIETCGFTQIAFVSGPAHSKGAQERERVYFQEMEEHGLTVSPTLFARGEFSGDCADVIEKLLDDNPQLEAIACACDLIAYTTYDVLRKRNIAVGEDIAVTGFDDHPRSAHLDPPLSTVHMTSYDYGCMAAREAVRLCEGLPQEEFALNSSFVARNSCGENALGSVSLIRQMLRQRPFPVEAFASLVVDASLSMAGPRITADFRARAVAFLDRVRERYLEHLAHPDDEVRLFSSQDLGALFVQDYRDHLSVEGFHSLAITLLEALMQESPLDDSAWFIEQISHLHLRVARMLSSSAQDESLERERREWKTFRIVDAALRENRDPAHAHELILQQLADLGVREADLFLLPEPVEFIGARTLVLSDKLRPIGRVVHGKVEAVTQDDSIPLQKLLSQVLEHYEPGHPCTVGGILAGTELLGVAAIDPGTLGLNEQLMAFLNTGFALKHLQLIASEREMNELLNRSNLLLSEESQHDELTGLLNRRGFNNQLEQLLRGQLGAHATIMFLDLDGLKTINDSLGHDVGDEAIRATAELLRDRMPSDALLCRQGGDEFLTCALVDDTQAQALADSLQADARAYNDTHDLPYTLSVSCGWACFDVDEQAIANHDEYVAQADQRLYEMKRMRKRSRRFGS